MQTNSARAQLAGMEHSVYRSPVDSVVTALESDINSGLTTEQAQQRLQLYGKNELPVAPPVPNWRKFLAQFENPLTFLLLIATAISFVTWLIDRDTPLPYEALTIFLIVLLNGILGFLQERRAEQAVAALRAMSAATTNVIRDGEQHSIPTIDVVPGDILLVEEGATIPADARISEAFALRVAESALTGESVPVFKHNKVIDEETGTGDQLNMVFKGTSVASGRGRAIVTTTGAGTEIGKIAESLQQAEKEETPLQKELDQVGKLLGIAVIIIAVIIALTVLFVDRISSLRDIVDVMLLAVSLAVAAVPEGLTAVTTIVLSLGMQRMATRNVIVRKLSAVETLGSTTVICTDKTGTLTKNEMTVRAIVTASGRVDLTGIGYDPEGQAMQNGRPLNDPVLQHEVMRALGASSLVNNATLLQQDGKWTIQGDPTEGALLVAARKLGVMYQELEQRFPRRSEIPFSSERKMMSTLHDDCKHEEYVRVLAKGAPDVLLARCSHEFVAGRIRSLSEERRNAILAGVDQLAIEALRTLGVASRKMRREDLRDEAYLQKSEHIEHNMVWLGAVGIIDPPREEALQAVQVAKQAGIRVIMITGDHPATASAIATELHIAKPGEEVMTGRALQNMDDERLLEVIRSVSVYARVAPEHKLRIVRALKANGEIVAMTGDGVNDAPALKRADIGVAMGITGTDVSKEAADMILTDDNFASIVAAVEEGRSIFANIQKFLRYLLSSNIGEVLVMFFGVVLAGLIGLTPEPGSKIVVPLLATQILWINLLTDAAPALALGVEPGDPHLMQKPPRNPKSRVIDNNTWLHIIFIGIIMALGTLLLLDWSLPGGLIPGKNGTILYARTMVFTVLVFFQLFNVFNVRSRERSAFYGLFSNRWIWWTILLSVLLQVIVIYTPFLQSAFGTVPLNVLDWLICTVVASSVLWIEELVKFVLRRR